MTPSKCDVNFVKHDSLNLICNFQLQTRRRKNLHSNIHKPKRWKEKRNKEKGRILNKPLDEKNEFYTFFEKFTWHSCQKKLTDKYIQFRKFFFHNLSLIKITLYNYLKSESTILIFKRMPIHKITKKKEENYTREIRRHLKY